LEREIRQKRILDAEDAAEMHTMLLRNIVRHAGTGDQRDGESIGGIDRIVDVIGDC